MRRPSSVMTAVAVAVLYLVNGATAWSIAPRLAEVSTSLGLSTWQLGLALTGQSIGILVVMVAATGWLIRRFGSKPVAIVSAIVYTAGMALPGIAGNGLALFAGLLVVGAANAPLDVAQATLALRAGRRLDRLRPRGRRRNVLPRFEAMQAIGTLIGVGAGAWAASRVPVATHLGLTAGVGLALVLATCWLLPGAESAEGEAAPDPDSESAAGARRGYTPRLAWLAALSFAVLWTESGVADWSAVFSRDELHVHPSQYGLAYLCFAVAVVVGRLAGGPLADRLGRVAVIRYGAVLLAGGMLAAVLAPSLLIACAALAVAGLGLANIHPLVLTSAGSEGPEGWALAKVNASYVAFAVEKPVIGFIAAASSLRVGLATAVLLGLLVAVRAGVAREAPLHR